MKLLSFFSVITLVLVTLDYEYPFSFISSQITSYSLNSNGKVIELFYSDKGYLPSEISEIRTFARINKRSFNPYDSFGNKLLYTRLSDEYFVLKSLSKDQIENSLINDDDISYTSLPTYEVLEYSYKKERRPYFEHLNLIKSYSKNKRYYASLFIDNRAISKKILVKKNNDENFVMLSYHDNVDEFIWLEDSYKIVYSTAKTNERAGGVFLWDLFLGTTTSLTNSTGFSPVEKKEEKAFLYQSLYGYDSKENTLYYFKVSSNEPALDPKSFYSAKNLYEIKFSKNHRTFKITRSEADKKFEFDYQPLNSGISMSIKNKDKLAENWNSLPKNGPITAIIQNWQKFSIENSESPLYSYCLWALGSIYGEAYFLYQHIKPSEANTLKKYGMNVSSALANLQTSPAYLRGFASFNYNKLSSSKPLNYKLTILPDKASEP